MSALAESKVADCVNTRPADDLGSARPRRWLYRTWRIGPWTTTYYASPLTQVILVSLLCFCCPGMYNALTGLGGGGQLDPTVANDSTVATYSTFAAVAFFAGTIHNKLGVRKTLVMGGFGYAVSVSSYICYNHTGNRGYVIFGGALAGFCAALLWTAQGAVVMGYPAESAKGKYISLNWAIFNMGAVIGALIPLGMTINGAGSNVGDGTYIAFTVIMLVGTCLGFLLVKTSLVIREDGSHVELPAQPSWKSELIGLWKTLRTDIFIIFLFPMFLSSNWFYTYQFNNYNLARFNIRTRSLNNVIYWAMQIIGSFVFGYALDWNRFSRPARARASWVALFLLTMATWGGGLKHQIGFERADVKPVAEERIDWTDPEFAPLFVLYMFWGFFDAAWQTCIYWYMGGLSNSPRKLSIYAGFYKSIQSTGNAIVWRLDTLLVSYTVMFGLAWGLPVLGLICSVPIVWFKIKDHTASEEGVT
ncbi:major facilitator superfamily domain-containing protein [Aspergillus pseudodeflectus]|uniref:Major facilitator superfamily domain-containing protein n=1 Tax=Aspergillus pseudodeflectus TaxID=176178 RepID=A0ABR4JLB0_9EURO